MKRAALIFVLVTLLVFLIYPLLYLLSGAFWVESSKGNYTFTLQAMWLVVDNPFYRTCFLNSFLIATATTICSAIIAIPLAWLFVRCHFPGKVWFQSLLLLPLILPPFVGAIGMQQFFAKFGTVNLMLAQLGWIELKTPPDWFADGGLVGMILLQTLHLVPILFLTVQAALANVDPAMRDAAANLGASGWKTFRTITIPLCLPGIFAGTTLVFISAFTDLGTPLMFQFEATVPTQLFNLVTQTNNPVGYALVLWMLIFVTLFFLVARRLSEGTYSMMSRSSVSESTITPHPWAQASLLLFLSLYILVTILPHAGIVIQSLSSYWFMSALPTQWSLAYYGEVFAHPLTLVSIQNSLLYSLLAVIATLFLGVAIAWFLAREDFVGKSLLDALAMLPLALPGIILAFAYFVTFTKPPFNQWIDPRGNPTLLLVIGYAIQRLPYIVRAAYAGLQQASSTLEEASLNLGASVGTTIQRITMPLIAAHVAGGAILAFSFAMLDVSKGLLLAQESAFYPLTKAIYAMMGRITPEAPSVASALGVLAMLLMAICLYLASRLLGKKMGALFRM